ncbi:MAG: hypothetical protein COV01_00920 [Candidatus Taylorbacteria bacterium CG10_big_fil_rev_8_21_14_0_10_41_48]|uniref:SIMPL domain-containing protein n=1 Tax=Candidatus Taylorbacteria bacterium CG10_big_fil_rev_8_21_14_0_10_41_48 TaxID=1975024 RepID=A0A2M8LD70_9BACT|nr:MAG: hypothetical protein COV01_00920 [Candidatus Taylorbacteria bacterium CG10_big_fil_rev_8_21_14_0_10_41_48]
MDINTLKRPIMLVAGALTLFLLVQSFAGIKGFSYIGGQNINGTISVSGKGEVIAVPDIATFSFSVSEEAPVVADAQKRATEKTNSILDFLKKNGVEDKDVKTTNYNIYPRYEYTGDRYGSYGTGKRVLVAYVITQSVEVKAREIDTAGTLLSGIGEFGATDVSGLSFSVDKYDDLVKEARAKAIAEARVNAKNLANDLDVSLVRVISYYDQNPSPIYYAKSAMMESSYGMGGDMVAPAPQLPSGENKIISNVSVTYEIR